MIKTMNVSDVKVLVENPPSRTTTAGLNGLVAYMEGRVMNNLPPLPQTERLVIGKDGILGDGHRRLAALKRIGEKRVEVEIDETRTAAEIWKERNSSSPITSRQVSEAAAAGLGIEYFPARTRYSAERLIKLCGQRGFDLVVKSNISFGITTVLITVINYTNKAGDQEFAFDLLKWVIKHKSQRLIRHAIEIAEVSPASILRAIKADRPLRLV